MTNEHVPAHEEDWPVGWAAQRDDQLTRMLAATPAERLAWLEEMIVFAFQTGALPRREPEE